MGTLDRTATRTSQFSADALQRTTTLMGLPSVLADMGVTLEQLQAACPVPPQVWTDPAFALPMSQVCSLLAAAAQLSSCPHIGLLLGARIDAGHLGAPGAWIASAPTLHDALLGFIMLQPYNTRAAALYLLDHGAETFLGYGIYDRTAPGREQVYALAMSVAVRSVRRLTRDRFGPSEVLFPFRAPQDATVFARVLGAPVRFDEANCGMLLPRAALGSATGAAGAILPGEWLRRAGDLLPLSARGWTMRTRHLLRPLLTNGRSVRAEVARLAGVSPRTLNRRLQAEGTELRLLVDEQRFVMAEELLLLTGLSVGDIALALGFEAEGSFYRSFRRWTGLTPEDWRRRHR